MASSINEHARAKLLFFGGLVVPLLVGLFLWALMPFVADKNPNSGYERLIAAIDAVKVSPLLIGSLLINIWMVFLPPKIGRWMYGAGILPVFAAWIYGVHLVSDADLGVTYLKLFLEGR